MYLQEMVMAEDVYIMLTKIGILRCMKFLRSIMMMNIKKMSAFLLVLFLLFSNRTVTSSAAENAGIGISVSPETVQAGERVTVTVSLTDYDEEAVPIRGM